MNIEIQEIKIQSDKAVVEVLCWDLDEQFRQSYVLRFSFDRENPTIADIERQALRQLKSNLTSIELALVTLI